MVFTHVPQSHTVPITRPIACPYRYIRDALCFTDIETCKEIEAGLPDGRSTRLYPFARQNRDYVKHLYFHLTWTRSACLPFFIVHLFIRLDDQPTRAHAQHVPMLHTATETAQKSASQFIRRLTSAIATVLH
eukprot:5947397-Pleurochrysis_carterae.AAC.1